MTIPAPVHDPPSGATADAHGSHLVRGSIWVMAGFAAHALTGIVFWLIAAHRFPSPVVGRSAAVFASLQFVNYLTAMGLQEMIGRFHHEDRAGRDTLFVWSVVVTVTTSAIGTATYLALVSDAGDVMREAGTVGGIAVFFGVSAGSAVALLADARFMATRQWPFVFWRLAVVGAVRIPLLWAPVPFDEALWLFLVMAGPIALSGLVGVGGLRITTGLRLAFRPRPASAAPATRYALVNYLAHLALLGPQFALPVIVLVNVGDRENAAFFLAWSIAAVAVILPVTIARVLVVEASRPGADLAAHARRALGLAVGIMAVATAAAWLGRSLIVSAYGSDYATAGDILGTLVAAGIPWAVTSVALGHSRVRHDPLGTVVMTVTLAGSILGLALWWVPADGAHGAARAWLVGNLAASGVAAALWRRAHRLPIAVRGTPGRRPVSPPIGGGTRTGRGAATSWS